MPVQETESITGLAVADRSPNGLIALGDGRRRVILERVQPEVDAGRYPIKRTPGEPVLVEVDAFADGHDVLSCVVRYRKEGASAWLEAPMAPLVNDRWRGSFTVGEVGRYEYTVAGWVDHFKTWEHQLHRRVDADQELTVDLLIGAELVAYAAAHAPADPAARLRAYADALRAGDHTAAFSPGLTDLMAAHAPRRYMSVYERTLIVVVDPALARFSSWYELFPRSASPRARPPRHLPRCDQPPALRRRAWASTCSTCRPSTRSATPSARARTTRPAPSPATPAAPGPSARSEGGHKAIHPELGTPGGFPRAGRARPASSTGSRSRWTSPSSARPTTPTCASTPSGSARRPDGTIQYAENPPKKYQDIYPFDFESQDWQGLWEELKHVFDSSGSSRACGSSGWTTRTPSRFRFWEWCIGEVKAEHPEAIFLSEAFTRPKVMYRLAKLGFTQSLHLLHLAQHQAGADRVFRRADPDRGARLLPAQPLAQHARHPHAEYLQYGGRAAPSSPGWSWRPRSRRATASTARPSSCCEHTPVARAARSTCDSEKYELRTWDLDDPRSLRGFIAALNRIRRENPALQRDRGPALPPRREQRRRERADHRLQQADRRPGQHRPGRGQPRPAPHAVRLGRAAAVRTGVSTRPRTRSTTCSATRASPGTRAQLRGAEPATRCRPTSSACAGACATSASSSLLVERLSDLTVAAGRTLTYRRDGREPSHALRRTEAHGHRNRRRSSDDPLWYKDAIIYELHVRAFCDSNGDGIGDFRGPDREARLPAGPGRHRHLAAALLPLAAARRRLRHRRLHRRPPGLRHAARLQAVPARGPPPRPARHHRAGAQPHLRPAPLVPARAPRQARQPPARLLRLERHAGPKYADARIIFKDFETSNWTWDPVAKAYYWHRFYSPPARPELRQPRRAQGDAPGARLLARHGRGRPAPGRRALPLRARGHQLREPARDPRLPASSCARHVDAQVPRPHAAGRGQPVARGRRSPTSATATSATWPSTSRSCRGCSWPSSMEDRFPIIDILRQTPAIPENCQWALFLRNHDELTLEMVTDEERDYMYRVYAARPAGAHQPRHPPPPGAAAGQQPPHASS